MITVRPSAERGHFRSDWLDSFHTFSFDTYYDSQQMGFRALRVINEDVVAPGHGFPLHRHADMEVLTVLLQGKLKHEDDLGHSAVIEAGDVQRFSAGTGIRHAEGNPSASESAHLLQIWILPAQKGLPPSYEQKRFAAEAFRGRLCLLASPDGREGSIVIHQDAFLRRALLTAGANLDYSMLPGRHVWLQLIAGRLRLNDVALTAGDGAAVEGEAPLRIVATEKADFLLFDLA
jgi:redox-sensitive bicupin YhaK (pirin superfamily)